MTIAIIGPGLIGRSVTLAARRADPALTVVEIDRGETLDDARGADLIVLAAPVDAVVALIHERADVLRAAVCLDTGSTKRAIVAAARAAGLTRFVGGHPMAGAAASGPAAARADLFDQRPWFLIPHAAEPAAVDTVRTFVTGLGARVVMMDDDGSEHDRVMAAVSHLPQVVAAALMVTAADAAGDRLAWAGAGLRDTTRLADSSSGVWQSILASNADELAPLLRRMAHHLEALAAGLEDGQSVGRLLAQANQARARLEQP